LPVRGIMLQKKLSIIIVNYNAGKYLIRCLKSLENNPAKSVCMEAVVVDNCSSDGSDVKMREKFPWVKLIKSQENNGFAMANNMGAKNSSGEYLLFVNPDIEFLPHSIDLMVDQLTKDSHVAAVAPQIISEDGSVYPSCWNFPNLIMETWDAIKFKKYFPKSKISLLRKRKFYMTQTFVEIISGACLMVRREAFDNIGGWDEDYFLYFEDDDLCYRLNRSGWLVEYYPESKVIHYGGKSTSQGGVSKARMYSGLFLFFKKHRGRLQTFLLTFVWMRKLLKYHAKYATNIFLIPQGKYERRK